jgi:hypothetical protein
VFLLLVGKIFAEARGRQTFLGAMQERQEGPARGIGTDRSACEPGADAGAAERILDQGLVTSGAAQENSA